jgi:hypothetical protein
MRAAARQVDAKAKMSAIAPILYPETRPDIWIDPGTGRRKRKSVVLDGIAKQCGVKPRALYRWIDTYQKTGGGGLARKTRSDKGYPRRITNAGAEFLSVFVPLRDALSVISIHRAYSDEVVWRQRHIGKRIEAADVPGRARWIDAAGRLTRSAILVPASAGTIRNWLVVYGAFRSARDKEITLSIPRR